MTPICQNVHEEDSAQLKDLGCPADGHPLKHNYGLQAYISDSSKIWVVYQMDDL